MAEKRPRGLRPWLDDIQLDDSGKYAYQGSHMKFSGGDGAYRAFRLKLGVCAALLAGCTVAAGCLDVGTLDNTYYVLIPYLLEVVLTAAFVWAAGRLLLSGVVVRAYVFAQTARRLPVLAALIALSAAAALIAAGVHLFLQKAIGVSSGVYLLLHAADCVCALVTFRVLRRAKWETV